MEHNKFDNEKDINIDVEYLDSGDKCSVRSNVSPAVIKRLPRYFRYLRELIRQGKSRISSGVCRWFCRKSRNQKFMTAL